MADAQDYSLDNDVANAQAGVEQERLDTAMARGRVNPMTNAQKLFSAALMGLVEGVRAGQGAPSTGTPLGRFAAAVSGAGAGYQAGQQIQQQQQQMEPIENVSPKLVQQFPFVQGIPVNKAIEIIKAVSPSIINEKKLQQQLAIEQLRAANLSPEQAGLLEKVLGLDPNSLKNVTSKFASMVTTAVGTEGRVKTAQNRLALDYKKFADDSRKDVTLTPEIKKELIARGASPEEINPIDKMSAENYASMLQKQFSANVGRGGGEITKIIGLGKSAVDSGKWLINEMDVDPQTGQPRKQVPLTTAFPAWIRKPLEATNNRAQLWRFHAQNMQDALSRFRTGAAINQQEIEIYQNMLTSVLNKPEVNLENLRNATEYFNAIVNGLNSGKIKYHADGNVPENERVSITENNQISPEFAAPISAPAQRRAPAPAPRNVPARTNATAPAGPDYSTEAFEKFMRGKK